MIKYCIEKWDKNKDKYYGDMECVDLFRYLKEKGEI